MIDKINSIFDKMNNLHGQDEYFYDLYSTEAINLLVKNKIATIGYIDAVENEQYLSYIRSYLLDIYNKFPYPEIVQCFERVVNRFSSTSVHSKWFAESLEELKTIIFDREVDRKIELYYEDLMTIFRNSSEAERYNIIVNTTENGDIQCYLNLSYDYDNDCIYPEYDFALCGEAFIYLVHKYPDAYFSNDRNNLIDIINLIDKSNCKEFFHIRDESLQLMRNSTDTGIISYVNSTKQEEYFKLMGIFSVDSFNAIIPRSKEVKEALAKLIERCEGSFLQYYFRQFVDKL